MFGIYKLGLTYSFTHHQKGAQVILLVNSYKTKYGLVNGSRGVVIDFRPTKSTKLGPDVLPVVRFDNGRDVKISPHLFQTNIDGQRKTGLQLPLSLAWALTVHKSQGMTLSRVELDISDSWDVGQSYTALSRVRDAKGLWIRSLPDKFEVDVKVMQFYGVNL